MEIQNSELERFKPKIVQLKGRLDAASISDRKEELIQKISADNTSVVINLREVSFIDSTGLGLLVAINQDIQRQGHKLSFCELSDQARLLFELTRLNLVFDLFDTQLAAVSAH